MVEREAAREAEAEPTQYEVGEYWYEVHQRQPQVVKDRATQGRVVISGKELPWRLARQGILKRMLPENPPIEFTPGDPATQGIMMMFQQQIPVRSGKHRHQGGLAIFVIEGEGYSIVDGVKHPWKAGDLILLTIKRNGVEHQHFNTSPKPSRWMAILPHPFRDVLFYQHQQVEESPLWKKDYEVRQEDIYKTKVRDV